MKSWLSCNMDRSSMQSLVILDALYTSGLALFCCSRSRSVFNTQCRLRDLSRLTRAPSCIKVPHIYALCVLQREKMLTSGMSLVAKESLRCWLSTSLVFGSVTKLLLQCHNMVGRQISCSEIVMVTAAWSDHVMSAMIELDTCCSNHLSTRKILILEYELIHLEWYV